MIILYKNKNKLDTIEDNFTFKLNIFDKKCSFIILPLDIYFEIFFIIFKTQAQIYFYINQDFILSFKDF